MRENKNLDIAAFQYRGRLVQKNGQRTISAFFQSQRLGQLDHLARAETEFGSPRGRVDIEPHLDQLLPCRSVATARGNEAEAREIGFLAEIDIFRHGHVQQQRLLLEHHGDTVSVGLAWIAEGDCTAKALDLAGVGTIYPGQYAHQRRFAGPILADQPDHLVRPHLDRHPSQGWNTRKRLLDPAHLQHAALLHNAQPNATRRERDGRDDHQALYRLVDVRRYAEQHHTVGKHGYD